MKKILSKLLVLALAFILAIGGTACTSTIPPVTPPITPPANSSSLEGVTEVAGKYFLYHRETDYELVVPDNPSPTLQLATVEFNTFFNESTGVELDVITESQLASGDTTYISLGNTNLSVSAGLTCTAEELNVNGYIIKTVGDAIYIISPVDNGVIFGVYHLLKAFIDYECFGVENYYLKTKVMNIGFKNIDIKEVPSFRDRTSGYDTLTAPEWKNRLNLYEDGNYIINGAAGHTSIYFVPMEKYMNPADPANYHRDWYMEDEVPADKMQLCYTARGDVDEYNALINACLETIIDCIKNQPDCNCINFSLTDNYNWCGCAACDAKVEAYKGKTGQVIVFLNDMIEAVYDWFETEEGRPYKKDVYIVFYAYQTLEEAPVVYDETTKTYKPVAPEVVCDEKVIPQLALTNANYTQSPTTHEKNEVAISNIRTWGVVAQNIWGYMYSYDYWNFLPPLDTFDAMQEWYQVYAQYGAKRIYDLGNSSDAGNQTGWGNLKIYLNAKLSWDVNADYAKLIDDFFKGTYRDASPFMRKIFDEYRVISAFAETHFPEAYITSHINRSPSWFDERIWQKNKLEEWLVDMDNALSAIEYMKASNAELYEKTYEFIVVERIWVNFLLYKIYNDLLPDAQLTELKAELYNDIVYCNLTRICQNELIDAFLAELKK